MLPAQDENQAISADSAFAENLHVFSASKIVESVDDLRHQLDAIELGEIAVAERQIDQIVVPLRHLDYVLGNLATLLRCQNKINLAEEENIQALEQVRLEVLSGPSLANPLLGLANLITLRNINRPTHETSVDGMRIAVRRVAPALAPPASAEQKASGETLTVEDELSPTDTPVENLTPSVSTQLGVSLQTHEPEAPTHQIIGAQESLGSTDESAAEVDEAWVKNLQTDEQTSDFDTKLLDDLIKNYGEFAANPNLPATLDKPSRETKTQEKPRRPKESGTGSARSPNDLDRQLKKLIKDYGENDLYSSQSGSLKIKLRIGAAFVVLALVLGGIYYFSALNTIAAPHGNLIQKSASGEGAEIAREPEPRGAGQKLSIQDGNTQPAAKLDDLPQADNKDVKSRQKKSEKGGTKR